MISVAKIHSHGGLKPPWFAMLATTLLVLIYAAPLWPVDTLLYRADAIETGEVWRLVTAHLVHLNFQHFAWNVGSFAMMASMAQLDLGISWRRQLGALAFSLIVIDALLLAGGYTAYAGLSGLLNGLLALMIWESWRQTRQTAVLAIAALSIAKIVYEAATGDTLFVDVPWPAAAEGHGGGFAAGLGFVVIECFWGRLKDGSLWKLLQDRLKISTKNNDLEKHYCWREKELESK
jgi:rhomboid family GlyGly-CTERM serine protease